ncbi:C-type lectin 37Db-like [Anopheles marshallii]|uniref:C-type lectin 37Db-like n=1 Tax=Anopheles marshallii TaxID=1521116 RepID=UPI00237C3D29|nr:C-type lectin 37Db-like [Anopheles marshallii]
MKHSFVTPIVAILTVSLLFQFQISAISHDAISFRVLQQKSYYFGSTFKLNWHKASAFCRSQGLFLVSINNQEQLDGVIDYVKKSGFFNTDKTLQMWTSGNDLGEQNQFIWTSTGERIVLDRWSVGEPNHAKENDCIIEQCVVLQHYEPPVPGGANYSLDDRTCHREYYFMCESLDS